jgi:hypothetical protein
MNKINTEDVISKEGGLISNSEGGLIQTQQSSTSVVDGDMKDGKEELVDDDEDPLVAEKLEMAALEKRVENRAMKLLEKAAINIQKDDMEVEKRGENNIKDTTKVTEEGSEDYMKKRMEGKDNIINTDSTEDDEEIDWDKVQDALDTNEVVDLTKVKKKKSELTAVRRSERQKNDSCRIQDKAEAAKRKTNEFTGKTTPLTVLNSIDAGNLEKLASVSNIKLGATAKQVSVSLSTIQAKELAKATLNAAKKRVEEQKESSQLEATTSESELKGKEVVDVENEEECLEGKTELRPPKKPPKMRGLERNKSRGSGSQNQQKQK